MTLDESTSIKSKTTRLRKLAKNRQCTRLEGYACIGDFHDKMYECDYVSPWTKWGGNINAEIMVVGQDWSDADSLTPPDWESAELGYGPTWPTNYNLECLLTRHFRLRPRDCYLTNVFPFIKSKANSRIYQKDYDYCANKFAVREIEIIEPRLVICLGKETFDALFKKWGTRIHCVAHTGSRGINNRGRSRVDNDWEALAEEFMGEWR